MARFGGVEPSGGVFADRRVQAEAQGFIGAGVGVNQRVRHQLVEQQLGVESFIGNERGGRAGGEAVGEHRQRREQPRLRRTEQFPAPLDDTLHRGVARIERTARAAARQQRQRRWWPWRHAITNQHAAQVGQAQAAHARRRQLDGQRQAMQRRHDVGHRGVVALAEVEVGTRGAGAVDKQRHRRVEGMVLQGRAGFRQGQRGQGVFDFAVQPQRAARRDEQVQLRQPLQPARDVCAGGFHELLEVVQHQQHATASQRAFNARVVVVAVGGSAVAMGLHRAHHGVVHLRCRAAGG